ncbi:hypothetical protein PMIN07_003765 [Paraphaeosphaeria minitans]
MFLTPFVHVTQHHGRCPGMPTNNQPKKARTIFTDDSRGAGRKSLSLSLTRYPGRERKKKKFSSPASPSSISPNLAQHRPSAKHREMSAAPPEQGLSCNAGARRGTAFDTWLAGHAAPGS